MSDPMHDPDAMRDPGPQPQPQVAGEWRLTRPPSERYGSTPDAGRTRAAGPEPGRDPDTGRDPDAVDAPGRRARAGATPGRGIALAAIVALVGAALIVVFGGALTVSAGLLVVASAIGYAVGLASVMGAAATLPPSRRSWIAGTLAGLGVLLGQVGLWLFARAEGGVLGPIDYLGQTFGVLVPVEVLLAAAVAWWRAR